MSKVYIQKRGLSRITWAVMREGRKTAVRIFQNMDAAIDYAVQISTPILMNYWDVFIMDTSGIVMWKEFRMKKATTSTNPSPIQQEE